MRPSGSVTCLMFIRFEVFKAVQAPNPINFKVLFGVFSTF
jgi:hypothetical protein